MDPVFVRLIVAGGLAGIAVLIHRIVHPPQHPTKPESPLWTLETMVMSGVLAALVYYEVFEKENTITKGAKESPGTPSHSLPWPEMAFLFLGLVTSLGIVWLFKKPLKDEE